MIAGISKRIQQEKEELVINLTHFQDGPTLPEVTELINSTNNNYHLYKDSEDGSSSLQAFFKRKYIRVKEIEIELCGCFRDVCILETWKGLRRLNYLVTPIKKNLTVATTTNWRKLKGYPKGYIAGGCNGI